MGPFTDLQCGWHDSWLAYMPLVLFAALAMVALLDKVAASRKDRWGDIAFILQLCLLIGLCVVGAMVTVLVDSSLKWIPNCAKVDWYIIMACTVAPVAYTFIQLFVLNNVQRSPGL